MMQLLLSETIECRTWELFCEFFFFFFFFTLKILEVVTNMLLECNLLEKIVNEIEAVCSLKDVSITVMKLGK